tara:strand:+ start:571 stop:2259 length:1689 start_codon:yes stop_codon:yes gene_type:complete
MNIFQQLKEKKVLDKDGKVDALGPYGRMKLTGREIATYFRKNKVKDKEIKKAVEVALDLGGADTIARKEIKKFYGDKILKSKEVQQALKFANEETFREQLEEDYKKVMKMYPRDNDWKKLINKHKRDIDNFRKNNKDLPRKVEDDLISWALDNGEISNKDEVEDFIDDILNESTLSEGKNLMPDIQKIVDTKGAAKVGGIMVDMFTASMINQIYNKVNDSNKKKMEKSNISTLVNIAQKMMQKMGDNIAEEVKTTLSEKPYDDKDVKNVEKLEKKLEKMLKEVDKTMRGSGLSAPAFSMVRGGIVKGLESIKKFYKIAKNVPMKENLEENIMSYPKKNEKKIRPMLMKIAKKHPKVKVSFGTHSKGKFVDDNNINFKGKDKDVDALLKDIQNNHKNLVKMMEAANPAQQAAIAISKKEKAGKPGYDKDGKSLKNEWIMADGTRRRVHEKDKRKQKKKNVMDSYREMWENGYMVEEVANITVDPRNKINSGQQQGYFGMEIAKQARRFGLKSAVMHKHIRIKGPKKKVNDFLRVVIGKSRYGDPTEKDMTTPQIDKMLNKGMK